MKTRKMLLSVIFAGTLLFASVSVGCGNTTTDTQAKSNQETETSEVIKPLYPLESAKDALADGGYSVAFTADDLVQKDAGYELTVEVYEYDRYETEDIEKLSSGSQIQVCNEIVKVEDVEKSDDTGYVIINGGIENNGIELVEDDGLYRTVTMNDYPVYYSVGEITIPVSDEVTFEDHWDFEKEPDGVVYSLEDLPTAVLNENAVFTCNNTIITVRAEEIVQIIRYWIP